MKTYRYIDGEYVIKNEIKHSVFICSIKGEVDENGADEFVKSVKKKYSDATHNCYAYIANENSTSAKFSDDGEPSGTAGQPMLEVLKKQGLVKTAVVVTRYFGGIKLGASGLLSAYTSAVVDAINVAKISEKVESKKIVIKTNYADFSVIENYFRRNNIFNYVSNFGNEVEINLYLPIDIADKVVSDINEITAGKSSIDLIDEIKFININKN